MSRAALGVLGRLARQCAAQNGEAAAGSALRRAHTEVSGRYSPNPFARNVKGAQPWDKSAQYIPKNPYIEAFMFRRDKMEREFSWDFRHTFEAIWFIGGVAYMFWAFSIFTLRHSDKRSHYPARHVFSGETGSGFINPDERDW